MKLHLLLLVIITLFSGCTHDFFNDVKVIKVGMNANEAEQLIFSLQGKVKIMGTIPVKDNFTGKEFVDYKVYNIPKNIELAIVSDSSISGNPILYLKYRDITDVHPVFVQWKELSEIKFKLVNEALQIIEIQSVSSHMCLGECH